MQMEGILVEERRAFIKVNDEYGIASTFHLNRTKQSAILCLPFLIAGFVSLISITTSVFAFGLFSALVYSFAVRSKYTFTKSHISSECQILDFSFSKNSYPLLELKQGILVVHVHRGSESYSVTFQHHNGVLEVTGLASKEQGEEIIRFVESLR